MTTQRARAGVTLLEVLIAVAVMSLLMGVLVPTLGGVRASAREAACLAQQRRMHVATTAWSMARDEWLPGINSTGAEYNSITGAQRLFFDTSSTTPTSIFDWISPVMGDEERFSPNRARRTFQILDRLACPEAGRTVDGLWGLATGDRAEFERIQFDEGYRQISYLSPGAFHLRGRPQSASDWTEPGRYRWAGPAYTPREYEPRLYMVGDDLSRKVFLADGTRYLASRDFLDFDINPRPQYYGSFTSSSPIYVASREYGRAPTSVEFAAENHSNQQVYPHNRNLSYRHAGRILVMYFDGHAGEMTEKESKTDAAPWFPSGSIYTGVRATEESLRFHDEGDELD